MDEALEIKNARKVIWTWHRSDNDKTGKIAIFQMNGFVQDSDLLFSWRC